MNFILFLFKIFVSLLCSYITVYLFVNNESKNKEYQLHAKLSLFGCSVLSLFYLISINIENYNLFISAIILFTLITFYFIKDISFNNKLLYILTFCNIVIVSTGYILYSFLLIGIYYFLINNQIFINEKEEFNDIHEIEDKNE